MTFQVEAVCISSRKGTPKSAVPFITLIPDWGITGDAHAGSGDRQVSLLAGEAIDTMRAQGLTLPHGAFGENVVTRGIDWLKTQIGDRVQIGTCLLEITRIGKECHTRCAIYHTTGDCIMPKQGVFVRVLQGGTIRAQDCGHHHIGSGQSR